MQILHDLEKEFMSREFPKFYPGDTVRAHLKIIEGNKERIQVFQGVVIAINKKMNRGTFVIRKISSGNYGVERIIPFYSPSLDKIEIVKHGRVRRAKLYYLRKRSGKAARIAERRR